MRQTRWVFIAIFFVVSLLSSFDLGSTINRMTTIGSVISLFFASCLHGLQRYGAKNTFVFFAITWVVSLFFEALSIQVGFPFGHYFYDKMAGPRLFQVPLLIMLGYFGMAYLSWVLSTILLRRYGQRLLGGSLFLVPLVATFIMVMWDVGMDPVSSTIDSLWVWKGGGAYFGVPLQNYFGWFLTLFVIFQIFAIYISRQDDKKGSLGKSFWAEAIVLYGIQGLFQVVAPFTMADHLEIYGSMAMVTIFTMLFVTLLSSITLKEEAITFL